MKMEPHDYEKIEDVVTFWTVDPFDYHSISHIYEVTKYNYLQLNVTKKSYGVEKPTP